MRQHNTRLQEKHAGMLQQLNEIERELAHYLLYMESPVSIDSLCAVSGKSSVHVLNIMEKLRAKKVLRNEKRHGKGVYFFSASDLLPFMQSNQSNELDESVIRKVLNYYQNTLEEGEDKLLLLADLFVRLQKPDQGLKYIKKAADILDKEGDRERAIIYYDYVLQAFHNYKPDNELADIFLDSVIKTATINVKLSMSAGDFFSILRKAETIAKNQNKWGHLAFVKAEMVRGFMFTGDIEKARTCVEDFQKLAEKIGEDWVLKLSGLIKSEFLFLQGYFSEAATCYEAVIGDLEEFGNDEGTLKAGALIGRCHVTCGRVARGMGMINAVMDKGERLGFQRVMMFADLMKVESFLETRRIHDAEVLLDHVCNTYKIIDDRFESSVINISKSFIHYSKSEYLEALRSYIKGIQSLHSEGWKAKMSGWGIECLSGLEALGFDDAKTVYDAEIKRLANSYDIYERGCAFRVSGTKKIKKREARLAGLQDLKESEKYLSRAGAEMELARTRIALGSYYLEEGETTKAQSCLKKAWKSFSAVDTGLFPTNLMSFLPQENQADFMINAIIDVSASLGKIHDASSFLERALNVAMDFTHATRGTFLIIQSGEPRIIASRNVDLVVLGAEYFNFIRHVISTMVENNGEMSIIGPPHETKTVNNMAKSAGVTSMVCVAAKLGDNIFGYLCVDNRLDDIPFPQNILPFIRMLCTQIAVGLSNIGLYNEMKKLKDRFEEEAVFYKEAMGISTPIEKIIGRSDSIGKVTKQIQQVAPTDSTVLILGETGVGKELVAKAIHNLSKRKDGPFIPVNLAVLPQELVASELFGHERGAFTGANEKRRGRFELADGGTIFLDEIGDLPLAIQVKLLRVLQEGVFERLGSTKTIQSDFRIIAATNKDLHVEVEKGTFRQDLYYRLNTFPVYVPPLRERKDDMPLLVRHFIDKYSKKLGKSIRRISADEMKKLFDYHWPGNVRELEHFIERAVILSDGYEITFSGLHHAVVEHIPEEELAFAPLSDHERDYIQKVLVSTGWRINGPRGAALILGIKPSTLFYRLKKLGIQIPRTLSSTK